MVFRWYKQSFQFLDEGLKPVFVLKRPETINSFQYGGDYG